MYCTNCRAEVSETDNYCRHCSEPLPKAVKAGVYVGKDVSTGGGMFVGRDSTVHKARYRTNSRSCISITVYVGACVVLVWLAALLAGIPEVRTMTGSIRKWLQGDAPPSQIITLPTPIPTFTPMPTPTVTPTPTPTPTATPVTKPIVGLWSEESGSFACLPDDILERIPSALVECDDLNANWVCVGNPTVEVQPLEYRVFGTRDRRPLSVLTSIETDRTGVAIVNLRLDGEQAPMRVILFSVPEEIDTSCIEQIPPGMIIRTEEGQRGTIELNGVTINLG